MVAWSSWKMISYVAQKNQCSTCLGLFWNWHKKGEYEKVGMCMKIMSCREDLNFRSSLILDTKSSMEWCPWVMTEGTRRWDDFTRKGHVYKYFWEVVNVDISHRYEWKTMCVTNGFYSNLTWNNTIVEICTRKLSCCGLCRSGE